MKPKVWTHLDGKAVCRRAGRSASSTDVSSHMAIQPRGLNHQIHMLLCLPSWGTLYITQLDPVHSQIIKGEKETGTAFTATMKLHAFVGKTVRYGICTVQPSLHTSEYNRTPRQAQAVPAPWGRRLSEEYSFHLMVHLPECCW